MKKFLMANVFTCFFLLAGIAHSAVVDLPDINGLGYFYDTESGLTWHDVDNFLNMTIDQILIEIENTGYHLATKDEITNISGINYVSILYMGGIYDAVNQVNIANGLGRDPWPLSGDYGRISLTGYSNGYGVSLSSAAPSQVYNGYGGWVVSNAVPLPGAIWLLGTGFISLIGFRRRLKA